MTVHATPEDCPVFPDWLLQAVMNEADKADLRADEIHSLFGTSLLADGGRAVRANSESC